MQTYQLKKKIEKMGICVNRVPHNYKDYLTGELIKESFRYHAKGPRNYVIWYDDDGEADCVKIARIGDNDDAMSDYTAGYFAKTYKSVLISLVEV